ncbi:MAG: ABC transporter permease [Sulfobacillus thermotolerans]|nr:ABC transporter permease [Sulfobacillus thermotolerans]
MAQFKVLVARELRDLVMQYSALALMVVFSIILPVAAAWYVSTMGSTPAFSFQSLFDLVSIELCVFPSFVPMMLSSSSLAAEFENRTLMALLAAPVSDRVLLVSKVCGILLPSIFQPLASEIIYFISSRYLFGIQATFGFDFIAFLIFFASGYETLIVIVGFTLSARVRKARSAQQYGSLILLPLMLGSLLGMPYWIYSQGINAVDKFVVPSSLFVIMFSFLILPRIWNRFSLSEKV